MTSQRPSVRMQLCGQPARPHHYDIGGTAPWIPQNFGSKAPRPKQRLLLMGRPRDGNDDQSRWDGHGVPAPHRSSQNGTHVVINEDAVHEDWRAELIDVAPAQRTTLFATIHTWIRSKWDQIDFRRLL